MNPRRFRAALVLAAALGVAECAPYASVSSVRPSFHPAGSKVDVERRISTALRQQKRKPLLAIGGLLAAAESAQQQLVRSPADIAARDAYNFAVARVIGTIRKARLDPWTRPLRVICGDRGKGGHKDKTKPVMSDGVVPNWSSHMETSQGYELRQEGMGGATLFANEASAMWAASAMCLRTGGKIVVRNAKGETVSTRRVHGTR